MLRRGSLSEFLVGEVLVPSRHQLLAQPTQQVLGHYCCGVRDQVTASPDQPRRAAENQPTDVVGGGQLPAAPASEVDWIRDGDPHASEQLGKTTREEAVPQFGGMQAIDAPRRGVIGTRGNVQIQAQGTTLGHHLVDSAVELLDPVAQGPAQRAGQPEHLPVIVIPGGEHHSADGLQRRDRGVKVFAQRNRIEVRPQRVVHARQDHCNVWFRHEGAGQLLASQVGHPCTEDRQIAVADFP